MKKRNVFIDSDKFNADEWLTIKQVMSIVGLSRSGLNYRIRKGILPKSCIKRVGKIGIRINLSNLLRLIGKC